MKKVLISVALASCLFAQDNYIEIGGGFVNQKDNFSVQSDKTISSLKGADSESTAFPYIEFFYGYDLTDSLNIYAQTGINGLNIGSIYETQFGDFEFGISYNSDEAWENPFLLSNKREKTDVKESGFYTSYSYAFNDFYQASISYSYSEVDYDKEELAKDLRREGERHVASFSNVFNSTIFSKDVSHILDFTHEFYDAKGKSSSYDRFDVTLGESIQIRDNISLTLLANIGKKEYDKRNQAVNKTVDVDIFGINSIFVWDRAFKYDNLYLSVKTGYEKEDANAKFYDKENTYGILSIGYRF